MSLQAVQPKDRARIEMVLALYGIDGKSARISQNTVGYVNKTFLVELGEKKTIVRESHRDTAPEHLDFEVEILRYLEKEKFQLSPHVLPNTSGQYLTKLEGSTWMLQNFVPGQVRASWNDVAHFESEMFRNFFRAAADFSRAAKDFVPSRSYPNEPLMYYTQNAPALYETRLSRMLPSDGLTFLSQEKDALLAFAKKTNDQLDAFDYDMLPKQLVHFDLHPGNVHFDGDKVVGLFDFDWARMDCRISDFAGAIVQSCYIYGGDRSGTYLKDRIVDGISAYREAYGESEFDLEQEQQILKAATRGYVFFQMFWCCQWYSEHPDRPEGMQILRHFRNACLLNDYDELFT